MGQSFDLQQNPERADLNSVGRMEQDSSPLCAVVAPRVPDKLETLHWMARRYLWWRKWSRDLLFLGLSKTSRRSSATSPDEQEPRVRSAFLSSLCSRGLTTLKPLR